VSENGEREDEKNIAGERVEELHDEKNNPVSRDSCEQYV